MTQSSTDKVEATGASSRVDGRLRSRSKPHALRSNLGQDIEHLTLGLNDLNVARWLAFVPHPYSATDAKALIKMCQEISNAGLRPAAYEFALKFKPEQGVIGSARLNKIDWNFGTGGGGFWIASPCHGTATDAKRSRPRSASVFANCAGYFDGNENSWAMQRKLGYRRIAEVTSRCMADGRQTIEHVTTLLRSDWEDREDEASNRARSHAVRKMIRDVQAEVLLMRMLIAAFAILLPAHAFAAGCDNPQALLHQAFPAAVDTSDGMTITGEYALRMKPEDLVCKVWPFKPELTLLAVPLLEAEPANEGEVRGDVEVIVADSNTGEPLARRREKGMAYADAVQFTGLELDTARYDIKPGIRAFGVVTRQFGSSMANPYSERSLWLYSFADGRLDRVLDGLVILQLNAEYDGNCTGTDTEITRTVGVAKTEHEGYRDLLVDQTETDSLSKPQSDDCKSTELSRKTKQLTLQFDRGRYQPTVASDEDRLFSYIEIAKDP